MRYCRSTTAVVKMWEFGRCRCIYLYHACPCTRCDEGSGRADVKGVVSVAARTDDVDEVLIGVIDDGWDGARKNERGSGEKKVFAKLDPSNGESREECADLLWEGSAWCDEVIDGELDICVAELFRRLYELQQERFKVGWIKGHDRSS
jgi:hypothetical protein